MPKSIVSTRVLIVQDGRVLVLRERMSDGRLKWGFPGGGLEAGEFPWDAAARECVEELGVPVVLGALEAIIFAVFPDGSHGIRYGIRGTLASDAPFVLEEKAEAHWLTEAEARTAEGWKTPGWDTLVEVAFHPAQTPVAHWYRDQVRIDPPQGF